MAHVHGEFLEEVDDQENIQMEMIVESEENVEIREIPNLTKSVDNNKKIKEDRENNRSVRHNVKNEKRSGVKILQDETKSQTDSGIVMACPLPLLGTTYQINSSVAGTPGGTFQPGTQYVLSKLKGKLPTLVMAEKKPTTTTKQTEEPLKMEKKSQEQLVTASTSQSSSKNHVVLKSLKTSSKRPRVSTHVIDTSKGIPVGGLQVSLYKLMDGRWTFLNESNTNPNGRCIDLLDNTKVNFTAGRYKMHFDIDKYFTLRKIETMYPFIEIVFDVKNPAGHYHIPVLLSPFGYSTYRGIDR